jgi:hypothetical protein
MKPGQNPFSLYDFLGYFTPGALFLLFLMTFFKQFQIYIPHLASSIEAWKSSPLDFLGTQALLPFILVAYAIGHLLNYLSSLIIERYALWIDGYPSKYLFGIHSPGYWSVGDKVCRRYALRFFLGLILLPLFIWDMPGRWFTINRLYLRPLDEVTQKLIKIKLDKISKRMGRKDSFDLLNNNFFNILYHYAIHRCGAHQSKFQNYVALYGFQRTLCLMFVFFSWASFVHILVCEESLLARTLILIITSGLTYIFFLAFNKFHRRFNIEVLLAVGTEF